MGLLFQGVYAIGQFFVMAVLIRRLGQQRFGMWLMIYALSAWMAFAKFGLQSTLYTAMGRHALTDRDRARAILTNVAGLVMLVGVVTAGMLLVFGRFLPWAQWLNVSDPQAVREAGMVTVIVLAMAALSMPMMMGGHAMIASQRGDLTQGIAAGAQVLMMALLVLGYWGGWSFPVLAAVVMSPPLIAGFVQWGVGLGWGVLPRLSMHDLDMRLLGRLLAAGGIFMVLDLTAITLLQGGPLVLGHTTDPGAVVPYGAAYRLIGLLIAAVMMISYAYWPAYSESGQRNDRAWLWRGVIRSVGMYVLLWLLGGGVILAAGRPFIRWWLGESAVPGMPMLVAALSFALCFGLYMLLATPLNGLGRLRGPLVSSGVMTVLFLILGILLSRPYGATGLYLGQAVAAGVGAGLNGLILWRVLRHMSQRPAST